MKISIPIRLLPIEADGHHLAVKLRINGKNANAILDTGASKTVLDKTMIVPYLSGEKFADNETLSTGLGTTTMQSQIVTIRSFGIGKITIAGYQSVILDLSHVNLTYEKLGLEPIVGVLGSDVLEKFKAVVDYGKRRLFLTEKKKPAKRRAGKTGKKSAGAKAGGKKTPAAKNSKTRGKRKNR